MLWWHVVNCDAMGLVHREKKELSMLLRWEWASRDRLGVWLGSRKEIETQDKKEKKKQREPGPKCKNRLNVGQGI